MSLQVWLPLNGSMENQGLLNLVPTQQGTINWVDGKIGKCLSAGTGSQVANGISYNSNLTNELGTEFSAAIWVKPLGNHVHYNGTFVSSGDWNRKKWAFGVSQDNSKVDVFCNSYNTYLDCPVPVNEWTHLICVHSGTTVKLYKNGEYIGEKTGVAEGLESDAANFCVGRETYANGYFSFNGNLNDLRIYNHALSIKEIKELSKGLVLHYKLDDLSFINENIFYDNSGYNYNGTITGTLVNDSDTPKYSFSTYFNGSSDIRTSAGSFGWWDFQEGTVCAWIKPTASRTGWSGSIGIQFDGAAGNRSFNIANYANKASWVIGVNGSWGASTSSITMELDTWYHLALTIQNGTDAILYVNGENVKTGTITNSTGVINSGNRFAVGVDLPGSDERFAGQISDVRFYVTALSAEDILELYHTSASIDRNGNLFCGELVE